MGKIIDGNKIAENILKNVRKEIQRKKLKLKLGVVLVGKNQVSLSYISQKEKACEEAGISFFLSSFPASIKSEKLKREIQRLSSSCSGIIVQLPLPSKIENQEVLNAVPEKKDIDILSEPNLGKFYTRGLPLPPTVKAVSYIIGYEQINLKGKEAVIVGTGRLVGKPLAIWLILQGATVSVVNKNTADISSFTRNADILISGAGSPGLIKKEMIKKGAVIIDAGTSVEHGALRGDIDSRGIFSRARVFASVPGGLGPITTACLIENLLEMNRKNN